MTTATEPQTEAGRLDLELRRFIEAPPALIWKAWTDPEHLRKWWAPAPVTVTKCEMDVRPGGKFNVSMRGPDGTDYPGNGVFLEVVEYERIVFTDALEAGWRPTENPFFTAIITLEAKDGGTQYIARAVHKDDSDRAKHEEMGFHDGWGKCLDQLATLVKDM